LISLRRVRKSPKRLTQPESGIQSVDGLGKNPCKEVSDRRTDGDLREGVRRTVIGPKATFVDQPPFRKAAIMELFNRRITKDQSKDTGMAMVLLLLIWAIRARRDGYLYAAITLQVINMVAPQIFRPVAVLWLAFADLLGAIMPKVLLSIVFFFVVTPVAILRRLAGKDSLKLRAFKVGKGSVMLERNHRFSATDLENPF
jgi:hypothetical protein